MSQRKPKEVLGLTINEWGAISSIVGVSLLIYLNFFKACPPTPKELA
jgi:hypothetical protein